MIYYYDINVEFKKNDTSFIKTYKSISFSELGHLFCYLEKKYGYKYTLISIKPSRHYF